MNRYLIAALYVMAGCVVAVPLKVQDKPVSLKESCRYPVITNTIKAVTACIEKKAVANHPPFHFIVDQYDFPELKVCNSEFSFARIILSDIRICSLASNKIRAPERLG